MEKERKYKLILIIALVIVVAGLSYGFAAFTKNLNINFSESNVNIAGDLDVRIVIFDPFTSNVDESSKIIEPLSYLLTAGVKANPFIISDDHLSISGGGVTFSGVNQMAGYVIALKNFGEQKAYLKSIDFKNYGETDSFKVCTALTGTDQNLVDQACESIGVYFSALDESFSFDSSTVNSVPLSVFDLSSQSLGAVALVITYGEDAVIPNGDFKINFGEIVFNYSSLAE